MNPKYKNYIADILFSLTKKLPISLQSLISYILFKPSFEKRGGGGGKIMLTFQLDAIAELQEILIIYRYMRMNTRVFQIMRQDNSQRFRFIKKVFLGSTQKVKIKQLQHVQSATMFG